MKKLLSILFVICAATASVSAANRQHTNPGKLEARSYLVLDDTKIVGTSLFTLFINQLEIVVTKYPDDVGLSSFLTNEVEGANTDTTRVAVAKTFAKNIRHYAFKDDVLRNDVDIKLARIFAELISMKDSIVVETVSEIATDLLVMFDSLDQARKIELDSIIKKLQICEGSCNTEYFDKLLVTSPAYLQGAFLKDCVKAAIIIHLVRINSDKQFKFVIVDDQNDISACTTFATVICLVGVGAYIFWNYVTQCASLQA